MKTSVFFVFLYLLCHLEAAKKTNKIVQEISDHKEFKKLLKTKTNVLIYFFDKPTSGKLINVLREVGDKVKGTGTIVSVDCSQSDGKKLCKKLKIKLTDGGYILKHYKDGDFNKDYDRLETVESMTTFMKDPKGDAPWEEDEASANVVHLNDPKQFAKLLKNERGRVLIMFYAPWCGFCKRMKPDYQLAAKEVKGTAVMAAMDTTLPNNNQISRKYNITGFPTLIYFENGVMQYGYPGENNRASLVNFLKNPKPEAEEKPKETEWKDEPSEVHHLTDDTFDKFLEEENSVLVMFYAPWCGHCKQMKPKFVSAAAKMKNLENVGKLAAVDCTKEQKIGSRFGVKGYPTVKYFKDGQEAFDAGHAREEEAIINFMKDPKEPPPPPPPEKSWADEPSEVLHLTEENFKPTLKKKKHVLVMFYAPWCGHCKNAKPELTAAADHYKDNVKVEYAAVDCTVHSSVCSAYEVSGYPTFKYFQYFNKEKKDYNGGRKKDDFINFMKDPENPLSQELPKPTPESEWKNHDGAEHVKHLTTESFFSEVQKHDHVLVMFYAPWCGHCKAMKGDYAGAAKRLAEDKSIGIMAGVDSTQQQQLSSIFNIKGFPTLKYFYKGKEYEEYNGNRRKMDFVEYLKKKIVASQKDEL